jgi:hypothetical protein
VVGVDGAYFARSEEFGGDEAIAELLVVEPREVAGVGGVAYLHGWLERALQRPGMAAGHG